MANETSFDIDIDVAAQTIEPAAASLAGLAQRLTEAGQASSAAAAAVKAGESAYRDAERSADAAAKALERIGVKAEEQSRMLAAAQTAGDTSVIDRTIAKLQELTVKQQVAQGRSDAARAALATEAAALDALQAAAKKAADAEDEISKALDASKKAAGDSSKAKASAEKEQTAALQKSQVVAAKIGAAGAGSIRINEMAEAFGKLGGPLGMVGNKALGAAEGVKKLIGSMGTAVGAMAAVVVVVAAVTAGLVAGAAAALKWAISLADSERSARLLSDGIAGSVDGGRELDKAIKALEKRVPQTSDELRSMAADLAKSGLKGAELSAALEDAALKAAELKWGPDFAKGAISLDKLATRLRTNIGKVFSGLQIESALEGLSKIVDMFDETSVTGKAIKVVFESLFQPLVDGLSALGPKIVSAFIQFEIWALKGLIAIKPYGSTILGVAKVFGVMGAVVAAAVGVAIGVIVAMAAAAASLVAGLVYLGLKFTELVAAVGAFAAALIAEPQKAFAWFQSAWNEVVAWLSGINLSQVGADMLQGLIDGIMNAGPALLKSMSSVVDGAVNGAKKLLGIASPSKVFAEIGANTSEGMSQGLEGGAAQVQSSMQDMVTPPAVTPVAAQAASAAPSPSAVSPPSPVAASPLAATEPVASAPVAAIAEAPPGPSARPAATAPALETVSVPSASTAPAPMADAGAYSGSKGSSSSLNLAGATFNFYGVEGAEGSESRFEAMLTRLLEGDAAQLGTEVPST